MVNDYEITEPQQSLTELAEQIFLPPYEPMEDIEALTQYQAQTTISTLQATVNLVAVMTMITMLGKVMKVAMVA